MNSIQTILAPDERLIYRTRPHWVYTALALIMLIGFSAAGIAFDIIIFHYFGPSARILLWPVPEFLRPFPSHISVVSAACILIGIFLFISLLIPSFAEIVLTRRRLFYKYGAINIRIKEVQLDEIQSQNINYGLLGWLFGYGKIHVDCRFVADFDLPAIGQPQKFLNCLQHAKSAPTIAGAGQDH